MPWQLAESSTTGVFLINLISSSTHFSDPFDLFLTCFLGQKGNLEKTQEFFQKQALELQGQAEWRDWFILPFIPTPEQNPAFGPYFSRQWADTFLVSLHNFLSVLFQCMHILHRKPQLQKTRLNEAINQSDRFISFFSFVSMFSEQVSVKMRICSQAADLVNRKNFFQYSKVRAPRAAILF